ncbi:hypothetical protein OGATHE_004412 [Ogataea polymorpha]|uniref:Uncharacterized protein n=1 Tax=Ogataea polymorpha TaxID=460523 RepID=A0A9P8T1S0_9ASCO|nr:hypothetical protein OGATHE_004412 [Ogataea polymorpha]
MFSPLEMPPWIPPELFVAVPSLPPFFTNGSLCSDPLILVPSKPEPISKPLVAGIESIAWASMASSLSKAGSPRPIGTFRITQVTMPPTESLRSLQSTTRRVISSAFSRMGQRIGPDWSTLSLVIVDKSSINSGFCTERSIWHSPTPETNATISTSFTCLRNFSAMAPAATRPIVSLAEDLPPPDEAFTPYLERYVKSACEGLGKTSISV